MAYLDIKPGVFQERLALDDYEIDRDGFCLWIKNNKSRQGYTLNYQDVGTMLLAMPLGPFPYDSTIIAVLTGDASIIKENPLWLPTDEQILTYCIDQALIPHPYEEYV